MKRFRQPEAFALVQQHYEPLVFNARMDSPTTVRVMLLDEATGESLLLTGLPCRISLSRAEIAGLIAAIDADAAALRPGLLNKLKRSQRLGLSQRSACSLCRLQPWRHRVQQASGEKRCLFPQRKEFGRQQPGMGDAHQARIEQQGQ